MSNYQVLFSGEIVSGANEDSVRGNLARELGIDDRKARQLFSGRTVVIRDQLGEDEAHSLQHRLNELGAVGRIKDRTPKDLRSNFEIDKNSADYTLRDITAAHVECPRCGHLQLETEHCARCGVDIAQAIKQKRKEDRIIEKKLRELRRTAAGKQPVREEEPDDEDIYAAAVASHENEKRGVLKRLFKRS